MDATFVRVLQERLTKARAELEGVVSARTSLVQEEARLTAKIKAMEVLLQDENPNLADSVVIKPGLTPPPAPTRSTVPPPPSPPSRSSIPTPAPCYPLPPSNSPFSAPPLPISIAGFIVNFIRNKNEAGTTHREIAEALTANNLRCHRNYPYVVIGKLKEEGKIVDDGGRLIWKK
jgi:hypothetical protein